jgi:hypothetical protein
MVRNPILCDLNHPLAALEPSVGQERRSVADGGPKVSIQWFCGPLVPDFGRRPTELGLCYHDQEVVTFCSSGQTMVHSSEKGTQWTSDLQDLQTPNGQTMLPEMAKRSFKSHTVEGGTGKAEAVELQDAGISLKQCPGKWCRKRLAY